jgi:hypothetical protein
VQVEPTFRRCFNVLHFLLLRAQRYDRRADDESDETTEEDAREKWEAVWEYTRSLNQGYIDWKGEQRRLFKEEGGEVEFRRNRASSRELNFQRYQVRSSPDLFRAGPDTFLFLC